MQSAIELINFTNLSSKEKSMVLSWRNHKDIRKWMRNKEEITLEEHLKFINSLSDKEDKVYFLVKESNKYIGVVDFTDIVKDEFSEFGIYAKPNLTGVGSTLMEVVVEYAFNILKLKTVTADVHVNNEKAIKLYEKFNFKKSKLGTKHSEEFIGMELKNENR